MFSGNVFLLMFWTGAASAYTMEVIGTATYGGSDYNLIWDDDNNGNSLVWLDYTNDNTNWDDQRAWAAGLDNALDITVYSGYSVNWIDSSWRLPNAAGGWGYDKTESEMGHLYYTELGNSSGSGGFTNTEDFDNLIPSWYWSGTEYAGNPDDAWFFTMNLGDQDYYRKSNYDYGLAVRSGQVSTAPIPEPTTSLLLGIGLLGLAGFTRCRKGSRC